MDLGDARVGGASLGANSAAPTGADDADIKLFHGCCVLAWK
jgi:hypothetical protein